MTDLLVHVRSAVDRWSASPQRVLAAGALALVAGLAAGALMGSKAWWIAGGLAVLLLIQPRANYWLPRVWAFLLPIEVVGSVPSVALDAWRYAALGLILLRFPADPGWRRHRVVLGIVAALTALAAVRLAAAGWHGDRTGLRTGTTAMVAVIGGAIVLARPRIHRGLLEGFLAGAALSAAVCLLQVLGVVDFRPGPLPAKRYPGLSAKTSVLTWQMAAGVVIGGRLWVESRRRGGGVAFLVGAGLCFAAMLLCGAQGGLVGLGAAALIVGGRALARIPRRHLMAAGMVVIVGAAGLLASTVWLEVDGLRPEKGFANELARVDLNRAGLETIVENPLGIGQSEFIERHGLLPHVSVVEAGATSGFLALALATTVLALLGYLAVRALRASSIVGWFGAALAIVTIAYSMLEPGGPFIGLARVTVLLLAAAACASAGDAVRREEHRAATTRR